MSERKEIVNGETISYEGYFRLADLYTLIDSWTRDHGFGKDDKLHEIKVKEEGRYVELNLQPARQLSHYAKVVIIIAISIAKMTDEKITIDEKEMLMNKGSIKIVLKSHLVTDLEGDWVSTPFMQVFQTIFEKFIFKRDVEEYEKIAINELRFLKNEISAFLNLNKFIAPHQNA